VTTAANRLSHLKSVSPAAASGEALQDFRNNAPRHSETKAATAAARPLAANSLQFHPLTDIFPLMEGEEFDALVADIKANGLNKPITLYLGKIKIAGGSRKRPWLILDGRNRYRACVKAGIEPRFEEFKGDDAAATAYVISANIHRRHLTTAQKRDLIAKLIKAEPEKSNNAIAKQARVDDKTVGKVRQGMEARSEIPNVESRNDTKGRKQPARKGWSPERWRRHKEKKKGKSKSSEARSSAPEREAVRARPDIGEVERLRARVDELQAEKRQLGLKIVGLESENAELKAANAELRVKLGLATGTPAGEPPKNGGRAATSPKRCDGSDLGQSASADTPTLEERAAALAGKGVQEPIPDFLLRKPTMVVS
jgi:hypothetical protein